MIISLRDCGYSRAADELQLTSAWHTFSTFSLLWRIRKNTHHNPSEFPPYWKTFRGALSNLRLSIRPVKVWALLFLQYVSNGFDWRNSAVLQLLETFGARSQRDRQNEHLELSCFCLYFLNFHLDLSKVDICLPMLLKMCMIWIRK